MPANIYFCTENYLKANTVLTANINITEILPLVKGAADMFTQHTLGRVFYADLLTKYNAQSLSPDETTLVGYMQPAIAWRACADAVMELSFQLKNKGVVSQSGDNITSTETKTVMLMNQHYINKAEFYENEMWQWLKENKALFPIFLSPANKKEVLGAIIDDKSNEFNSQIFFT